MTQINVELIEVHIEVHKLFVRNFSALVDKIKGMCTSLMTLLGSIIDQSQEYYSFNDVPLIIWTVNKFN